MSALELDVAVTADLVPVVAHDPVLNPDLARAPGGNWLSPPCPPIHRLSLAALRRLDVGRARPGSATARAFPDQIACDGARIPTLAEVFATTAASGVWIDAELKTDPRAPELTVTPAMMADLVVAVARAAGALGRLAVRSFDWRGLRHLQGASPDLPLAWLTEAATVSARTVADAAGASANRPVWAPDHASLTQALVAEAHALGLRVLPWTVNAPADMARLIDWGVDGLCTDRPDLARTAMAARGVPLPPRTPCGGPASGCAQAPRRADYRSSSLSPG